MDEILDAGNDNFCNQKEVTSEALKGENVWQKSAKYKGIKLFEGYVTQDYYLDFVDKLGEPIRIEQDNTSLQDTSFQLAEGIQALSKLHNDLLQKSKKLTKQESIIEQKRKGASEYAYRVYNQMPE